MSLNSNKKTKKSKLLLTLCAMLLFGFILNVGRAQQMQIDSLTNALNESIKTVQTSKYIYEQKIESPQSCILKYSVTNIDNKGKTTNNVYELNIADIDPNIVRQQTSGDMIYVQIVMDKNQKMIKVSKNGKLQPYISSIKIIAEDINNARHLRDLIKKANNPKSIFEYVADTEKLKSR